MINYEQVSMDIIINAGVAKSNAMFAIRKIKEKNWKEVEQLLLEGKNALTKALQTHFEIIQKESQGQKLEFKLLLMHAEDQLMNAQTCLDLVEELMLLFK